MDETNELRVLVVDDEQEIRELTVRALGAEGFLCDTAAGGQQAIDMLDSGDYDVVVTDLRMPKGHGYALVTDVLERSNRPNIVVLTAIAEPRLTRDLLERGVDYMEFKPVKYELFAAKVRGVASRRERSRSHSHSKATNRGVTSQARAVRERRGSARPSSHKSGRKASEDSSAKAGDKNQERVTDRSISRRLIEFAQRKTLPDAAKKVLDLANAEDFKPRKVAKAINRDSRLKKDVVRMANTPRFRGSAERIDDLQQAILQIGRKRIGEYAVASSARHELSTAISAWLNLDLAWRRSVAAGAAIDWLLDRRAGSAADRGLSLSARMQPFGRIVLGMTYPDKYQDLIKEARESNQSLRVCESRVFARSPNEVIAHLMERWGISPAMTQPLRFASEDYMSLLKLEEPLTSRAELVKFAIWIGRLAVGRWEPWDLIEVPPGITARRLQVDQPGEMIADVRAHVEDVLKQGIYPECIERPSEEEKEPTIEREFPYCCLSPEPYDYLPQVAQAMKIGLKHLDPASFAKAGTALVNCIWTLPDSLSTFLCKNDARNGLLIVTDRGNLSSFNCFGQTMGVPTSFGALRAVCRNAKSEAP